MSYDGPHFDGDTYEPHEDYERLGTLLERVKATMLDGQWHTLAEIRRLAGGTEASVSARLRDLRKHKFGSHTVLRHRQHGGLFLYRLVRPTTGPQLMLI